MQLTIKPMWGVAMLVTVALLAGMAIGQVTSAGAGPTQESSVSLYPVIRQLQQINATLGSDSAGSIEPLLREIELNTYYGCAAEQGHHLGGCSHIGG